MEPAHSGAVVFQDRGVKMVGVLNRPALRSSRRRPAVLFLHGFPGAEKNVDVQRRLLAMGVGSLSLHFRGAWGSAGVYSFRELVPQARAALRFLGKQSFVDPRRLGMFGFSMGGWTAINAAAAEPRVRAVAAVAPVGGIEMVTSRTTSYLARLGACLRAPSPADLTRDLAAALREHDPVEAAARLGRPLLLVHGLRDDVVSPSVSRRIHAAASAPKKLALFPDARHDFLDHRDRLVRLTADWLAARLA